MTQKQHLLRYFILKISFMHFVEKYKVYEKKITFVQFFKTQTFQLLGVINFSAKTFSEEPKVQNWTKFTDVASKATFWNLTVEERTNQLFNDSNPISIDLTDEEISNQLLNDSKKIYSALTKIETAQNLSNDSNSISINLTKTEETQSLPNNSTPISKGSKDDEINKQLLDDSKPIQEDTTEESGTTNSDLLIPIQLGSKAYYALEEVQNKMKSQV
jgi:hypothetical protein